MSCSTSAVADDRNGRNCLYERCERQSVAGESFSRNHGLQCGYCTPGMLMAGTYLLRENPNPTEEEIRRGIKEISVAVPDT